MSAAAGGWGRSRQRLAVVPWWAWLSCSSRRLRSCRSVFDSGYVRRVAFDTVVFMLLALGLNIVVGWGGLLDLGFVAFYGIGAYTYAFLSSDKFDIHLPTLVVIPLVAIVGGIVGLLVGLPSRRLTGDYLAIVTLFFFQIFLTFTNNSDNIFGHNLTSGPNGILNVDQFTLFGCEHARVATRGHLQRRLPLRRARLSSSSSTSRCTCVNDSRTGRAWRSLREDPLAAELMGMPVNWLKLMAFAFGAAVAALTGTLVDGAQRQRLPADFEFPLLITVYTMVILGGAGQPGRRRARRDPDQRAARGAARPGRRALALLRRRPARARRRVPRLAAARRRRSAARSSSGSSPTASPGAIDDSWTSGSASGSGRARRAGRPTG